MPSQARSGLLTWILVVYSFQVLFFLVLVSVETVRILGTPAEVAAVETGYINPYLSLLKTLALVGVEAVITVGLWMFKKWALYLALISLVLGVVYSFMHPSGFDHIMSLIGNCVIAYAFITHWNCFD